MTEDKFTIEAEDGKRIFVYRWLPAEKKKLKCIVQISHGMAEHAERYKGFAEYLNEKGIGVYANDHRGHGKTAGAIEDVGYFDDHSGWDLVVNDMFILTEKIKNENPGIPVFMFGHSMGSFLSRDYIARPESEVSGVILSGTAGDPGILGNVGIMIAKLSCRIKGAKKPDKLLDKLSFGSFNNGIKQPRTKFDWLSRDDKVVDKYIADDYCGGIFSSGFFLDLFQGIKKINKKDNIRNIPVELPVYFISGEKDPVGDNSKGVVKVMKSFTKAGVKDIEYKFYENGRHEMLNELNKDEVYSDIFNWIESKL
ncbi:MAG: lysophospholipase [Candidatus Aminicenantes bacterium]|nr:lysophospholipase [Candidatus Aminicenantes bacterium]